MVSDPFTLRPLTASEVMAMVDAGILSEDEPVELIDGRLVAVSPQKPIHRILTVVLHDLLIRAYGDGHHVQDHSPIDAGPTSMPEPDVALVRGEPWDLAGRHPGGDDLVLVAEVVGTTHAQARAKAGVYARAGVPVYWLIDVPGRRVEVHSKPDTSVGEYAVVTVLRDSEEVELPGLAGAKVPVATLLGPP